MLPSAPTSPKVVSIFDGEPTAQGPVPEIVTALEQALEQARDGRLRSILIVGERPGGGFRDWHYDHEQGFRLLGLAAIATHDLTAHLGGDD